MNIPFMEMMIMSETSSIYVQITWHVRAKNYSENVIKFVWLKEKLSAFQKFLTHPEDVA